MPVAQSARSTRCSMPGVLLPWASPPEEGSPSIRVLQCRGGGLVPAPGTQTPQQPDLGMFLMLAPLRASGAAGGPRPATFSSCREPGMGRGGESSGGTAGPGAGAGSAGGGGHTPYLGVTMVIAVVGWRMWQVVMVKVDGVWGRLLTERNTGRDRRQGVNGEGGRTQVEGTAEGRRDSQSWAGSSMHGAQLQQQLRSGACSEGAASTGGTRRCRLSQTCPFQAAEGQQGLAGVMARAHPAGAARERPLRGCRRSIPVGGQGQAAARGESTAGGEGQPRQEDRGIAGAASPWSPHPTLTPGALLGFGGC